MPVLPSNRNQSIDLHSKCRTTMFNRTKYRVRTLEIVHTVSLQHAAIRKSFEQKDTYVFFLKKHHSS